MNEDVWVIIPAHNEEKNIQNVILETKKYCENIVVVDDGSCDNTKRLAQDSGATVLTHIINLGKGSALKTGCDYAYKKGAKKIVLMDSDGQHQPSEIPHFLKALENNDIVFGCRNFDQKMPWVFKFGNRFINWATKILYGIRINDTQSGYRAFNTGIYRKIRWKATDYSVESEMIANLGRKNLKYNQIPIQTIYEDNYKGTTIFDGIKIVFNMFFWRLK